VGGSQCSFCEANCRCLTQDEGFNVLIAVSCVPKNRSVSNVLGCSDVWVLNEMHRNELRASVMAANVN